MSPTLELAPTLIPQPDLFVALATPWHGAAGIGAAGWFALGALLGAAGVGILAATIGHRRGRRVQDAKRRAREAERMAEMGALAAGLAHEIKNPLSTIGLNAQLLAEAVQDLKIDDADKTSMIRRVRTLGAEAERLRDILTDFLEFAGEMKLDARPSDLNLVVEELADFYMPQAEKQGVRLRVDLAPGPLIAEIDPQLVKQGVLNLILNGVQAMTGAPDHNGTHELILRTERRSDCVALHVIDTGPGIRPEALEKIFHPYFTTKAGGSGLGLPTAKRIVELQLGTLKVHSEPGRGTDFTIAFPEGGKETERRRDEETK